LAKVKSLVVEYSGVKKEAPYILPWVVGGEIYRALKHNREMLTTLYTINIRGRLNRDEYFLTLG